MLNKLLRTIIGLPFVLVMWLFIIVVSPFVLVLIWAIEGRIEKEWVNSDDFLLPIVFLKKVWKNENWTKNE